MTTTCLPRVLVLLATHNGGQWLPAQIASLRKQVNVHLNVVINDDASTDDTRVLLGRLAPDWTLLPEGPRLGSAAQNFFHLFRQANLSGHDYVALCDQDDEWYADKLARAVQKLQTSGAQGYSSNVLAFWTDRQEALIYKAQRQRQWDYLFEAAGPGCTYVVPVAVAQAFQAWLRSHEALTKNIRFHDWLLYAWVRSQGGAWVIDSQPSMRYRQHTHNEIGANLGLRAAWRRGQRVLSGFAFDQARQITQCLGNNEQQFLGHGLNRGMAGFIWLAGQARECRRRRRDQVLFALVSLWMGLENALGGLCRLRR